jgi:proline iminopeptidase
VTPAGDHLDEILYPAIEPYETGYLVGDGQRVYWEQSGNPEGKPVVFLHGGPGGGTSPGSGASSTPRSTASCCSTSAGAASRRPHERARCRPRYNTTWHLVADMELLRKNLGIETLAGLRRVVGSALALAYAECHPDAVTEIVLRGVFTLRRHELEWFYEGGASALFPDLWESYLEPIPVLERSRMIEAYHRRLSDPDPAVHQSAAHAWTAWEASTLTLEPDHGLVDSMTEPRRPSPSRASRTTTS